MRICGFDLGDGESAVTLLQDASTVEPQVIPISGHVSVLSAVGIREGQIVVGEEASVMLGAENTRVRFKSRYLTDPQAAEDIRAFAQGVAASLRQEAPAMMAEISKTVIGCPAGWGETRRLQYAALIESAGFPNVSVVPESRAAFLYARHARGLRIDPSLMQHSAMVIDVGSSTTDFAYIVDGHQQNLSLFGDTSLGGGLLDEIILRRSVENSRDASAIRRVFRESPAWRSYCELEARRLKEQYFLNEEKWQEVPLRHRVQVCYDEELCFDISLNGRIIREIITEKLPALGGRSFVKCLQDALKAAEDFSRECPPQVVILTGGASRMGFLQDAVRSAFSDSLLVMCPEPECSIARGLAYCGRVDENLKLFRTQVNSIARGDILTGAVNASIYELYQPIASTLYETAEESTLSAVSLWRHGGIETIEELSSYIEREIAASFSGEEVKKMLSESISAWLIKLMRTLEGELIALCERCGIPTEHMSLEKARVETGLEHVDLSLTDAMGMNVLSGIVGGVLAVVGAVICGGGGVAIISSGPIGMVTGAIAGILVALLGKSSMEKALSRVKLPVVMRRMVTDNAVRRGMQRQREKIEEEIVRALADPKNGFSARLCASLASTLGTQMEALARDAEMSITA